MGRVLTVADVEAAQLQSAALGVLTLGDGLQSSSTDHVTFLEFARGI